MSAPKIDSVTVRCEHCRRFFENIVERDDYHVLTLTCTHCEKDQPFVMAVGWTDLPPDPGSPEVDLPALHRMSQELFTNPQENSHD